VKRRVGENGREGERRERTRSWVPCALVSGYTPYGSKRRYSGKFRVMQQQQQQQQQCGLSLSLSRYASPRSLLLSCSCIVSFLCLYFARRSSLFSFLAPRSPVGAARFVSFFVSGDKPTVRSRRSRRPTAYTRTRQLLRTTRHIVSTSTSDSLSLSLSLSIFRFSKSRCIAR